VQQGQIGPDVRYVIQDWHLPAFEVLLQGIQGEESSLKKRKQLEVLCGLLSSMWPDLKAAGQLEATYAITTGKKQKDPKAKADAPTSSSGSTRIVAGRKAAATTSSSTLLSAAAGTWQPGTSKLPSSLLLSLQATPWLLASDGAPHAPSELFLPLHDAKQLFQDKVLYLGCEGVVPRDMASQLGVTCDASLDKILTVLTAWSQAAAEPAAAPSAAQGPPAAGNSNVGTADAAAAVRQSGFTASLADMQRIYNRIADLVGDAALPESGFATLDTWQQQQQRSGQPGNAAAAAGDSAAAVPRAVLVRLQACKAFADAPLIWLPDASEVRTAAAKAAAAAAAAQQHAAGDGYYEEGVRYGGSSSGSRGPARSQRHHRRQVAQQAAEAAPAAAVAVPDGVMYDVDVMNSLQRERMRGRFYSPGQLRFNDDARLLEVISLMMLSNAATAVEAAATHAPATAAGVEQQPQEPTAAASTAAGADAASQCLRVAGLYYGGDLQELFVRQLQRYRYNSWIPLIGACRAAIVIQYAARSVLY
jgi:hypothetical protein